MKNNNISNSKNNNHHNRNDANTHNKGYQHGSQHEKRKSHQSQSHHHQQEYRQQQQSQQQSQQHQQQPRHYSQHQQQQQPQQQYQSQRDRSGQRSHQHPDSSMSRDYRDQSREISGIHTNLGSIKFSPGYPTRELPPIETKADGTKKFTGRCRLFVGNLPHNTTEDKLRSLFETYGEVGEVYLGPKSAFAFVKMDTKQAAEAARDALDCSLFEGRTLRVRLTAHAAAIRVKHLSSQVTNELLAYAFRYFGEIERAVVVVDDKGKSVGEGIVEFSRKQSALYAVKRCQQECFLLTASSMPVLVELFDQQDEDEGLPEKSINKNSNEFKEQRDIGPRFAEQGTFEHTFALRWKELYDIEKQKRIRLDQEIEEARKNLISQIEYSRLEHDTMELKNRLQQLEDDRMKLQQLKEQTISTSQQREEQRRQQDLLIRQREEEILRRQRNKDYPAFPTHQEHIFGMAMQPTIPTNNLQEVIINQDLAEDVSETSKRKNKSAAQRTGTEPDSINMIPSQLPAQSNSYGENPMLSGLAGHGFGSMQPLGIPTSHNAQINGPSLFPAFMPTHQMQMTVDASGSGFPSSSTTGYAMMPQQQDSSMFERQDKYVSSGNNIDVLQANNSGRPRKRGRF